MRSPHVSRGRQIACCAAIFLLALLMIFAGFSRWLRERVASVLEARSNPPAAIEANNFGIALLEQHRYLDAIAEFEKVVKLAPDWLPGRINLGIALLNAGGGDPDFTRRGQTLFEEILNREPDNPNAHFCLGILLIYQKDTAEAIRHFEAVIQKDPNDAYSWYWLGALQTPGSEDQAQCFREALKRDRHLQGALYGLAMTARRTNPELAETLLGEHEVLSKIDWENTAMTRYGEMGPYAEAVGGAGNSPGPTPSGPLPRFQPLPLEVRLAGAARWATAADFGQSAVNEVRRWVQTRFGATMVVLDYNRDGKPDLFLAGAVVEKGQVRDLLLRNDGGGRFTDVTAEAGLAEPRPTLGCVVADFDNDRSPDLLLTGVGVQKLFRNADGKFVDVTAVTGLDKLTSVCLGAAFLDLDHDGNLDILLCEYAPTTLQAVNALRGEKLPGRLDERQPGGLAVFLNTGTAPQVKEDAPRPTLTCAFRQLGGVQGLKEAQWPLTALATADLDGDGDLDWFVFADRDLPTPVLNDRLLHFRRQDLPFFLLPRGAWNAALVLDADHDGRSDVLLIGTRQRPLLLLRRTPPGVEDGNRWFTTRSSDAPSLRQAMAADVDLDSWTDVVGLAEDGRPVLLHNTGGQLKEEAAALGGNGPGDLVAVTVCDLDDDDRPDVVLWSASEGLQWCRNQNNGNNALRLELACTSQRHNGSLVRCSADGFGARVLVHAGLVTAGEEVVTRAAGLGQSWKPLLLGLGPARRADVIRVRWPDGTRQAERGFLPDRRNLIVWRERKISW
jgi:hypothetical protein